MCSHVPDKGEQMVRYYGHYSNVSRGKRKKADADNKIPVSWNLNSQIWHFEKIGRGLSASGGLIQKIYEVDPLTCPKCKVQCG